MSETSEAEAQRARTRAQRIIQWGAAAVALLLILGVSGFALQQRRNAARQEALTAEAVRQKGEAEKLTALAEAGYRKGQVTESYFRTVQAKAAGEDVVTAALLALEGLKDEASDDEAQRTRPFVNEPWHALYDARLRQRERTVLSGHAGAIRSAVFSPDGSRILTASDDKTARLWDGDGKALATLEGHTGPVFSAVFSPDGSRILTASDDKTARLWDGDGKPLVTLAGHTGRVDSAVFAPDGGRILTAASDDKTARLWNRDGKLLTTLEGHTGRVYSAVFSPDGRRVLTASDDKTARLWEPGSASGPSHGWHTVVTLKGRHMGSFFYSAVFAPDGSRILTASWDSPAQLWDRDGKPLATLEGHKSYVESAVFSPDGSRILTASSGDKTARLWEAFPIVQLLVDRMKAEVPRCLTPKQRRRHFLNPTPPSWCITMQKWPYDNAALAAKEASRSVIPPWISYWLE